MRARRSGARRAVAALVLLGAVAACSGGGSSDDGAKDPAVQPAKEGIDGVLAFRVDSAKHTLGKVDYDRHPPVGGDHNPSAAACGFYTQPVPDEYVVHTMEHGAVWLAYATDLSADELAVIRGVVTKNVDTIATPYPGLDPGVKVVMGAWARQLQLKSVTDPRLEKFVDRYQNGDQAPEASVACGQLPPGQG
jgi:hypothetical protein